jgi:hypothetical protein
VRSKGPSRADRVLLAELAGRGVAVSYPRLERWRYWRKTGLVPRTIQHGQGRGSTSEHENLEESISRVSEVARLRRRYRSLDRIALVLTMRGRPLDPESVKQALLAVFTSGHRQFLSYRNSNHDDPVAVAHNAVRAAKHAGAAARSAGDTPAGPLSNQALLPAALLLAGAELQPAELTEFVGGSPIADIAAEHGYSVEDVVNELEPHMNDMSLERMRETLVAAAPSAVVRALRNAENLVSAYIPARAFATPKDRDGAVIGFTLAQLMQSEP